MKKHILRRILLSGILSLVGLMAAQAQVKYKFTANGLGLGTADPQFMLDVKGTANLEGQTNIKNVTLQSEIKFIAPSGYSHHILRQVDDANDGSRFEIAGYNWMANGAYLPLMTIKTLGFVGIGTTSPAYTLDVAGTVRTGENLMSQSTDGGLWFRTSTDPAFDNNALYCTDENWMLPRGFTILGSTASPAAMYMPNFTVFATNSYFQGAVTCYGFANNSDRRLKNSIADFTDLQISKLMVIRGVNYRFNPDVAGGNASLAGIQYGLIAQEVQDVFPDLVKTDDKGFLSVNYIGFIPLLIENAKAQKTEIETLKEEVEKLKAEKNEMTQLKERMAALEKMMLLNAEEAKLKK